jgi:hypothetical protein
MVGDTKGKDFHKDTTAADLVGVLSRAQATASLRDGMISNRAGADPKVKCKTQQVQIQAFSTAHP